MNTLNLNQSSKENMDLLYAQAYLYDRIKIFSNINFIISIAVPIVLSILAAFLKSKWGFSQEEISPCLGVYGLAVLTLNLLLSGYISSERKKAATIQEMYDCEVLRLKWNELKVGKQISRDVIFNAASFYNDNKEKTLKRFGTEGWYVNKTYEAPQNVMALLCHGKNMGWDSSLRDKLNIIYIAGMVVSFFSLVVYAVFMNAKFNDALFYVVFSLPLIRYFLIQFLDNRKSREKISKLKQFIEKEIADIKIAGILNDDELNYKLRSLQDEVFVHRATASSVPNFIHLLSKKKNEIVYDDYFHENIKLMKFI